MPSPKSRALFANRRLSLLKVQMQMRLVRVVGLWAKHRGPAAMAESPSVRLRSSRHLDGHQGGLLNTNAVNFLQVVRQPSPCILFDRFAHRLCEVGAR
jgi:hypothetical protein